MKKYEILVNTLNALRKEAPKSFKSYYPDEDDVDKVNAANSKAYIHLLLKAKFNLLNFKEREKYITDGPQDGGIDAYYVDHKKKEIYFIQSKFRTNGDNFENKFISVEEIIKMDIDRISTGKCEDNKGIKYNSKIIKLVHDLSEIEQISRYDFYIILLANVDRVTDSIIKKLFGDIPYEIYNYEKAYEELVFPIVRGTVHQATDISVNLNLGSKNNYTMDYLVKEGEFTTSVQLFFVPIIEIAKLMSNYKNSILKYNPRSYLGASNNEVNTSIKDSVINRSDNVFALFNNGITILSDKTSFTSRIGREGIGELSLLNPQIINGGQTAYTLSTILDDKNMSNNVFDNKEVLVKVITFDEEMKSEDNKRKLIDDLSLTTNNQSKVTAADRKSNTEVQIELQKYLYNKYGYFYHRKKGEFSEGLDKGYITKDQIIDRNIIIRIIYAINGKPSEARSSGEDQLYKKSDYDKFFNKKIDYKLYDRIYYSYLVHKYLCKTEKELVDKTTYGEGLRYGKYAIVYAVSRYLIENYFDKTEDKLYLITNEILNQWRDFEICQSKKEANKKYFYEKDEIINKNILGNGDFEKELIKKSIEDYDNYYKGSTLNEDLKNYNFKINVNKK